MARVLCTGADPGLLRTRKMLLEQASHTVTSASSEPELREACAEQEFDVAVIGQSLSSPMKRRILALVREHRPDAKVLELYLPAQGRDLPGADDWLEVPAKIPTDFVERVSSLSAPVKRKKGDAGERS